MNNKTLKIVFMVAFILQTFFIGLVLISEFSTSKQDQVQVPVYKCIEKDGKKIACKPIGNLYIMHDNGVVKGFVYKDSKGKETWNDWDVVINDLK